MISYTKNAIRPASIARRQLFIGMGAIIAVAVSSPIPTGKAFAQRSVQGFPTRPIKLIVPFLAGGPTDVLARTLADHIGRNLGQPVVTENRPGATGQIGMEILSKANPDGHTIGLASLGSIAINPSMNRKLPWNPLTDFKPLAYLGSTQMVLLVNQNFPANNLKEFIDLAKSQPGRIRYASGGAGGSHHLATLLLQDLTKIDMVHVPYKGSSAALSDVMGGHVDVILEPTISALPLVQGGKLRALGLSGIKRYASLPDIPLISETVPDYEFTVWFGLFAPAKTPPLAASRLTEEIQKALADPQIRDRLTQTGMDVQFESPERLAELLKTDIVKWDKILRKANLTSDGS